MSRTLIARTLASAVLGAGLLLVAPAGPANAYPYTGPYQSLHTMYFAQVGGARTLVGESAKGECGEDFEWGVHTADRVYEVWDCSPAS